ncbi:hypothetical protein PITC_034290 [Penicillium italicum]|uniref:Uncharacterized protein n=1 Tax=Penicillium italicum TaxID=40296 RepID=A0A0A2LG35_PENIT|nr:hypothetical protein PITC_034290 [Penicillium italicum]
MLYGYKRDTLIIAQYEIHAFSNACQKKIEWGNSRRPRARAEVHPPLQTHVEYGYGKSSLQ